MPTRFDIRRHGESDHNLKPSRFGLVEESHLTPTGVGQAEEMAISVSDLAITRIVASSLIRAIETATIIAMSKNLEVEVSDQLRERGYGSLDGMTGEQLRRNSKRHTGPIQLFQRKINSMQNWFQTWKALLKHRKGLFLI